MPQTTVRTGVTLNYEISGSGDPLLLIMGTSGSIPLWGELSGRLAQTHQVIAFDNRGLGGSDRGAGPIDVATLAEDASGLLEALGIPRAHVLGWSLGSAVVQELALAHPEQVASAVMYATWGRCDGFQRSVLSALRLPYVHRDMESALATAGLAFSPQLLDHPDFGSMMEPMLPAFPQNEAQMQVTVEQWDADLAHDSLDRLGGITAPTLVLVGEQDLLTPPWQAKKVADAVPGARYELVTGPGSSHGMHIERPEELTKIVIGFLASATRS
ncbi:alpha/beta hydrolase [Pseudonocardia sp. EC080610-09]|uniref:alpha/beta fold hydrolase n=1 Tax=unclassified Pseudonocardia TaxID=2619320 RepID=UPI0006CB4CEE|nr:MULTISPECIES: alpha/beta fold hydrolase [unclassified Pseudonocardia]ALE75716.1 alpha/beta hydrolase [Pseudonocardia sp. EC080625-04]ALL75098.1 alpha/beta hydrolase [Pseudonocardia sp. EC080610-09]ALL82120.1 alpha/beta hydrolase [Pseudonocardia sp. EC080619-01]